MDEAWRTYSRDRCACHREMLIVRYYPLVQRVAGKMWRATPSQVDLDDLTSYGTLGLIRAVEHYDPESRVAFETYAVASIRGVILDELRTLDWAPRSLRRRQREIDRATDELESELGRSPTRDEVGARIGRTGAEVRRTMQATESAKPRSLDETDEPDSISRYEHVEDAAAPAPHVLSERAVAHRELEKLIASLTPQERLVVVLYYYERMTLAQVGVVIGIPESRASQIHTKAMMLVRESLQRTMQEARAATEVSA